MKQEIQEKKVGIRNAWESLHEEYGQFKMYLRNDLSDTEKKEVKDLLKWTHRAVKEKEKIFLRDFVSTGDVSADIDWLVVELAWLREETFDKLVPYTNLDQQDVFDAFVLDWIATFKENKTQKIELRINRKNIRQMKTLKRKHHLPDTLMKKLRNILPRLSGDNEKRLEVLKRFSDLLDTKIKNISENPKLTDENKERLLDLLEEFQEVLDEEIANIEDEEENQMMEDALDAVVVTEDEDTEGVNEEGEDANEEENVDESHENNEEEDETGEDDA